MHVVAIGGGGGATQVLRAAAPFATRRTAVIAVTDTGRSTGLARQIGAIPAPGDLRATIAAFAQDPLWAGLLQHRFDGAGVPQLEGMAFGNLLIAALARHTGDFDRAVQLTAALAGSAVQVLPVSAADTQLCARLAHGGQRVGELAVRGLNKPPIAQLWLDPPAAASADAVAAIRTADLVVIGPGSLFTTVLATLQFAGLVEALRQTDAVVAYVANTTAQPGQTDGYSLADHVARVVEALGPGVLDAAIINDGLADEAQRVRLAADGLVPLACDAVQRAAIERLGVAPLAGDLVERGGDARALWNKQDTIKHDVARLGAALASLLQR